MCTTQHSMLCFSAYLCLMCCKVAGCACCKLSGACQAVLKCGVLAVRRSPVQWMCMLPDQHTAWLLSAAWALSTAPLPSTAWKMSTAHLLTSESFIALSWVSSKNGCQMLLECMVLLAQAPELSSRNPLKCNRVF
jgi:hypothetical protein